MDIQAITSSMSEVRFSTYMRAAAFDQERALRLYLWNIEIGSAFHLPIQSLEVVLRNRLVRQLRDYFGPQWWDSTCFLNDLNRESRRVLKQVKRRASKDLSSISEGQIVSALSFGFWSSLMNPDNGFDPLQDWMEAHPSHEVVFVRRSIGRVCDLRNRISHHEPIFRMDLSYEYSSIMTLLRWLCPATHEWIRPHCRVPSLMRQKP